MRYLVLVGLSLFVVGCTEATASRIDERTFEIEGPSMGIMSDAPNRRLASRVCPHGYRVLDSESHKGGLDRATDDPNTTTVWKIRCI